MVELPDNEIAEKVKENLNSNPNYKESAKTWEGELYLEFKADSNKLDKNLYLWLDLHHGICRNAEFVWDKESKPYEYTISASEENWRGLFNGEIDPNKALMAGKFKIQGNMGKLMRYPKAAAYVLKYMTRHLKDW